MRVPRLRNEVICQVPPAVSSRNSLSSSGLVFLIFTLWGVLFSPGLPTVTGPSQSLKLGAFLCLQCPDSYKGFPFPEALTCSLTLAPSSVATQHVSTTTALQQLCKDLNSLTLFFQLISFHCLPETCSRSHTLELVEAGFKLYVLDILVSYGYCSK